MIARENEDGNTDGDTNLNTTTIAGTTQKFLKDDNPLKSSQLETSHDKANKTQTNGHSNLESPLRLGKKMSETAKNMTIGSQNSDVIKRPKLEI